MIRQRYANPRYPLVPLGTVTTLVQYGTSARSSSEATGVPVLRIPNLQSEGWDLSDLKYLELTPEELDTYRLQKGDILFNRTNGSRELVGKCEVFDFDGDWVFASYLIRLKTDRRRASPEFVTSFLNTYWGRRQVEHVSRQILMSNINTEEIRALRLPLPALEQQDYLVNELQVARTRRKNMLQESDSLLAGVETFAMRELGLHVPSTGSASSPFAVRLGSVRGRRLDPPAHRPFPIPSNPNGIPILRLESIADVDRYRAPKKADDEALVPYVGLPECDLSEVRRVTMRKYKEVRGRSVARPGDILFARIEPSVFNKKYVYAEHLHGNDYAYLSTEFYAVRAHGDSDDDQRYLYAMFHSDFVHNQVRGKTTGSSGRRRIDSDLFKSLLIPWPDAGIRKKVSAELVRRRNEARRLQAEAGELWERARSQFEVALLGPDERT